MLHSAFDERCSNHHRRNFAPENGVFLRVSTTLRLRDHFCAEGQMFRLRGARVALCFGVRIHVVMASPSVMLKVVYLLEAEEGWLIAQSGPLCGRSGAPQCGRGTDVHWRHVAFQRESPRQDIASSYATTRNHMTSRTASSTRERGM